MTPALDTPTSDRTVRALMTTVGVAILAGVAGGFVSGPSVVAMGVLMVAFSAQMLVTLRLARRRLWARAALMGFLLLTAGAVAIGFATSELPPAFGAYALSPSARVDRSLGAAQCVLGFASAGLLLTTTPLRPVTRVLFRMSPEHPLYAPAILFTTLSLGVVFAAVAYAGGPPSLLMLETMARTKGPPAVSYETGPLIFGALATIAVTLSLSLIAVGVFTDRTVAAAGDRLGLHWPAPAAVGPIALGLVAIVAASLVHEQLAPPLAGLFGGKPTTETDLSGLFAGVTGALSGTLFALVAGTTEEFMFRGVLQPQLGLVSTTALFAAAHGFQYRLDALIVVFFMGLVLGVLREKHGLVAAMVVHVAYDFLALVVMS
jgi:membrane protease YdiL (CAAX protease family)